MGWLRLFFLEKIKEPTENNKFECDEKLDVVQLGESYLNSFSNINPTFTHWVTIFLWLYRFLQQMDVIQIKAILLKRKEVEVNPPQV